MKKKITEWIKISIKSDPFHLYSQRSSSLKYFSCRNCASAASFRRILKSSSRYLSRSVFLLVPFSVLHLVKSLPFDIPWAWKGTPFGRSFPVYFLRSTPFLGLSGTLRESLTKMFSCEVVFLALFSRVFSWMSERQKPLGIGNSCTEFTSWCWFSGPQMLADPISCKIWKYGIWNLHTAPSGGQNLRRGGESWKINAKVFARMDTPK